MIFCVVVECNSKSVTYELIMFPSKSSSENVDTNFIKSFYTLIVSYTHTKINDIYIFIISFD